MNFESNQDTDFVFAPDILTALQLLPVMFGSPARAQTHTAGAVETMSQDDRKRKVARAALEYIQGIAIIGVGTGSTANFFVAALAEHEVQLEGAIASSEETARRLEAIGVNVLTLNDVGTIEVYVDGADETTRTGALIKGGGGALTREKIVAAASNRFVCIVDESKLVPRLGAFPLPVEIIPMARSLVTHELNALGGRAQWRAGFVTDNGNDILDVHDLDISDPVALESELNQLAGVVTNGLFARRPADVVLVGTAKGVETLP